MVKFTILKAFGELFWYEVVRDELLGLKLFGRVGVNDEAAHDVEVAVLWAQLMFDMVVRVCVRVDRSAMVATLHVGGVAAQSVHLPWAALLVRLRHSPRVVHVPR
jgi:hypothetical protein